MPFFDVERSCNEVTDNADTDNENGEADDGALRSKPLVSWCSERGCPWAARDKCEYGGCSRLVCLHHVETSILAPPSSSARQPMPAPHWVSCKVCPQHTKSALGRAIVEADKSRAARDEAELTTINDQLQTASLWQTMQLTPRKLQLVPELFLHLLILSIFGMLLLPFGHLANFIAVAMGVRYAVTHGKGAAGVLPPSPWKNV